MNIGVVNVIHLLKKEGRSRIKISTGDPVLMGCEKANTTRGYWGIFLKYWILWASLEHGWFPLSRYGNGGIDSLTPVPWHTTGIGHPTCSLGGLKRATGCEHMKYRFLRACLAVVKLLVFNCAFLKRHRSCQPCCPTCIASQLYFCSYKQFKTTEWSRQASELLIKEDLSIFPQDKQYCTSRLY